MRTQIAGLLAVLTALVGLAVTVAPAASATDSDDSCNFYASAAHTEIIDSTHHYYMA